MSGLARCSPKPRFTPALGRNLQDSTPVAQTDAALDAGVRPGGRDAVTWYSYLLLGYFTYVVSIQGNILPFLRDELDLSYRAVSLHTSAIAVGIILSAFSANASSGRSAGGGCSSWRRSALRLRPWR